MQSRPQIGLVLKIALFADQSITIQETATSNSNSKTQTIKTKNLTFGLYLFVTENIAAAQFYLQQSEHTKTTYFSRANTTSLWQAVGNQSSTSQSTQHSGTFMLERILIPRKTM